MPFCLYLDLPGTCNSQECIQQMTQHLTKYTVIIAFALNLG